MTPAAEVNINVIVEQTTKKGYICEIKCVEARKSEMSGNETREKAKCGRMKHTGIEK